MGAMSKLIDMLGTQWGRWTVIDRAGTRRTDAVWLCQCECGIVKEVLGWTLRDGSSAGCLRCSKTKHGLSQTRLYDIWHGMMGRCYRPNHNRYYTYGARGVRVCDEWHDVNKFAKWAQMNGYEAPLTIDRIDNDGSYCAGNCRWIPSEMQARNRSNTCYITYYGERKSLCEWADEFGLSLCLLRSRWSAGRHGAEILTTPKRLITGDRMKGLLR